VTKKAIDNGGDDNNVIISCRDLSASDWNCSKILTPRDRKQWDSFVRTTALHVWETESSFCTIGYLQVFRSRLKTDLFARSYSVSLHWLLPR